MRSLVRCCVVLCRVVLCCVVWFGQVKSSQVKPRKALRCKSLRACVCARCVCVCMCVCLSLVHSWLPRSHALAQSFRMSVSVHARAFVVAGMSSRGFSCRVPLFVRSVSRRQFGFALLSPVLRCSPSVCFSLPGQAMRMSWFPESFSARCTTTNPETGPADRRD